MNMKWLPTKTGVINGLKSLPLTILLTVLIWMYAEAQFTATQEGVEISVKILPANNDQVVRVLNAGSMQNPVMIQATIQGTKSTVDRVWSMESTVPESAVGNLAYRIGAEDIKQGSVDTVRMLNQLPYFRQNGLTAVTAQPPRLQLSIEAINSQLLMPEVSVWVGGSPEFLARRTVELRPGKVQIVVAGNDAKIKQMRAAMEAGKETGVRAYVDVGSDVKTETVISGAIRYELPEGVVLREGPTEVEYVVHEK